MKPARLIVLALMSMAIAFTLHFSGSIFAQVNDNTNNQTERFIVHEVELWDTSQFLMYAIIGIVVPVIAGIGIVVWKRKRSKL